jgi:drug/metabolite transporter (DMT)-like permease
MAEANSKRAIIAGIVMIAIYAVQFVAARFSLRDHLTPSDLAILRFTAAGAAFLPIMMRAGFAGARALGLRKAAALALLAGLPYPLVINWGLTRAPAAHAAALCPASIIFFSFLLSRVVFADRISSDRAIGIAAIIAGLLLLIAPTGGIVTGTAFGDALFVGSGLMFAVYAVLVRRWSVDPVLATASVVLLSCIPIPLLFAVAPSGFTTAPGSEIVAQFVIQGFVAGAGATFLYTYIVRQLGPQAASLFLPFVPVTATLLGVIALAEVPGPWQILAILIMAAGMAYPAISGRKAAKRPNVR